MAIVQIHFDGDIAKKHQVSMRTLGKTLVHLQNSFDRACIEKRKGALWKYAKMPQAFYADVELLVREPREGGYVLDFLAKNAATKAIIDRVTQAITTAVEQTKQKGITQTENIEHTLNIRRTQIEKGIVTPRNFASIVDRPDANVIRRYGDRAIVREIDQILSIIRSANSGNSTFELLLDGTESSTFGFDKTEAKRFHAIVSKRTIGDPVIYTAEVTSLDKTNLNGKIKNITTNKTANIIFANKTSLKLAIPFFDNGEEMHFVGCPFIEYGAFDPMAGDIYFLELVPNG